MNSTISIDTIPLWLLYLICATIVLLAIELGWRLGDQSRQRSEEENKVSIGAAVGATLGLLAFLLAFTFGMAASRYDTRKQNVLLEANAIGTTYLRADFLPESSREEARNLVREYTVLRSGGRSSIMSPQGMAESASLQDRLWAIADEARIQSDTVATGLFIQSLNDLIDLDAVRVTAHLNRIPNTIWLMLGVVAFFSMAALGYELGMAGSRSWVVTILMVITFTSVILLIADLDRSQAGLLQVSQQPLLDLLNKIGTPVP
jgi:hypothetical protein